MRSFHLTSCCLPDAKYKIILCFYEQLHYQIDRYVTTRFSPGWCSFYPSLTVVHHGIPCYEMQLGNLCLPPSHPEAMNCDDSVVFDTFRRYTAVILSTYSWFLKVTRRLFVTNSTCAGRNAANEMQQIKKQNNKKHKCLIFFFVFAVMTSPHSTPQPCMFSAAWPVSARPPCPAGGWTASAPAPHNPLLADQTGARPQEQPPVPRLLNASVRWTPSCSLPRSTE